MKIIAWNPADRHAQIVLLALALIALISSLPPSEQAEEDKSTGFFESLIRATVKEEKWRKRIKTALEGIPIEGEAREKFDIALSEMGIVKKGGGKNRELLTIFTGMTAVGTLLTGLSHAGTFFGGVLSWLTGSSKKTTTTTTTVPPPTTTTSTTTSTTATPSPFAKIDQCCKPCCITPKEGAGKIVCQRSSCPVLPANQSECADFPVCLPPCRLEVIDPPPPPKPVVNADEEDDDDFDERQGRKVMAGAKYFDEMFRDYCKSKSICASVMDVFNALPNNVGKETREQLIDVIVYFRDQLPHHGGGKQRSRPDDLTVSQLVKGIVGNLFMKAMRKANKKGTHRAMAFDEVEQRRRREEENKQREPGLYYGPYCGVCLDSCESDLKKCEISCPNNKPCKRGKCVCQ